MPFSISDKPKVAITIGISGFCPGFIRRTIGTMVVRSNSAPRQKVVTATAGKISQ